MIAITPKGTKPKLNSVHDVRTVVTYSREINFGAVLFRIIYESLGLHRFFKARQDELQLDFDLDAVVFCICFFNIERKLGEPLDLKDLARRRCIFDFDEVSLQLINRTLEVIQLFEPELLSYVNRKAAKFVRNRSQQVKHSPNSKVVLKSLAYLLRSMYINKVADAGYNVTKDPLFTLTFEGTILRPSEPDNSKGFVHINKAYGRYGTGSDDKVITVRKLLAVFGIDAQVPMRNARELKRAFKVRFPYNKEFYTCPQRLPALPADHKFDIDIKDAEDTHKIEGVDFLFTGPKKEPAKPDPYAPRVRRSSAKRSGSKKGSLFDDGDELF